ncbi:MAG: NTP transferase domain-containing protein [Proteobacteria bacterium]|nr:NTP transferase domain-containing protein [Pseudomonadota bacterium]
MKVIIPAAGLGTRMLPATKVVPKALLPVARKPVIQWALREAAEAGLREVIVVIAPAHTAIRRFLTPTSGEFGNQPDVAALDDLLRTVTITFVEQPKPRGLGDALLCCQDAVASAPFAVMLPDNVLPETSRVMRTLLAVHARTGKSCIALRRQVSSKANLEVESLGDQLHAIRGVVRAYQRARAGLERVGGVGRYVLTSECFPILQRNAGASAGGELSDVDMLDELARGDRLLGAMTAEPLRHVGADDTDAPSSWSDAWKHDVPGHAELWNLHATLRDEIRARWNRRVPFADTLLDRWEIAHNLGFGEGASVYDSSLILGDVAVGAHTWVGPFTVLDGRGGLAIGQYCSISAGVQVYSHNTVEWALSGGRAQETRQRTTIGDNCYIGPHSVVSAGVTIGHHSVVGANSFVRRDVAPFSIVAGSPANPIGRVELADNGDIRLVYPARSAGPQDE